MVDHFASFRFKSSCNSAICCFKALEKCTYINDIFFNIAKDLNVLGRNLQAKGRKIHTKILVLISKKKDLCNRDDER